MNCTEVGELMQRNLDRDLNELELKTLMAHLSDCAQCTVLFDKLTLLSGSLEQLPRVVPSISIVDAILPELERIDKAKANSLIIAKQRRTRWLTTAGSIATAAAIIVLMVNLNGTPTSNNASIADLAMKTGNKNDAANDLASTNLFVTTGEKEEAADSSSERSRSTDAVEQYSISSGAVYDGFKSIGEQSIEDNRIEEGTSYTSTFPSISNNRAAGETPGATTDPVLPEEADSLTESIDKLGGLSEFTVKVQNQTGYDADTDANTTTIPQYFSNDEQVYLQFEEHTIALYETSSQQVLQEWELPQQGLFEFIQWENEGKSFTFQVTDETGEITSYSREISER